MALGAITRVCVAALLLLWPHDEAFPDPLFKISEDVFNGAGGFGQSANFSLFGSASFAASAALRLGLTAGANQTTFSIGQTLSATVGITNPGLPGAADLYVGLLKPDGSIEFVTGGGIAFGNVADLASFRAIAVGVPLGTPFSVIVPEFFSYRWTPSDVRGGYTVFLFALTTGALADGAVTAEEILGIAAAIVSFL